MSILAVAARSAACASRSLGSALVDPGGDVVVTITATYYGLAGDVTDILTAAFR